MEVIFTAWISLYNYLNCCPMALTLGFRKCQVAVKIKLEITLHCPYSGAHWKPCDYTIMKKIMLHTTVY